MSEKKKFPPFDKCSWFVCLRREPRDVSASEFDETEICYRGLKKKEIRVFLSAEKRFKVVKTTPKVCTQKSFFLNISKNNYIFWVKPMPKYFF